MFLKNFLRTQRVGLGGKFDLLPCRHETYARCGSRVMRIREELSAFKDDWSGLVVNRNGYWCRRLGLWSVGVIVGRVVDKFVGIDGVKSHLAKVFLYCALEINVLA